MVQGSRGAPAGTRLKHSTSRNLGCVRTLLTAGLCLWGVSLLIPSEYAQNACTYRYSLRSHTKSGFKGEDENCTRSISAQLSEIGCVIQPRRIPQIALRSSGNPCPHYGTGKVIRQLSGPEALNTTTHSHAATTGEGSARQQLLEAIDREGTGRRPAGDGELTLSSSSSPARQPRYDPARISRDQQIQSWAPFASTSELNIFQEQSVVTRRLLTEQHQLSEQLTFDNHSQSPADQQISTGAPQIPADFDWQAYLQNHPEVKDEGVDSLETAKHHYVHRGKTKGLVHKKLRVVLRYTAGTGLINQHYSHIAAFALAVELGAELVLPPAVKRDSFAKDFSRHEVSWTPDHLDTLLDIDAISLFWKDRQLAVHKTPALLPFPDLTHPETAYPLYSQPSMDLRLITNMSNVYIQTLDMRELVDRARSAVRDHAMAILQADAHQRLDYIVLDLPCTLFMLRTASKLHVVTEVAKSLRFSPMLHNMADQIIDGMTNGGREEYNGMHLRMERDAQEWYQRMGGEKAVWEMYVQAMQGADFTGSLVVYAASGLLTYGANAEMSHIVEALKELGLCSAVHHKEMYFSDSEISDLNSEQKALLDFLVLSRSRNFVGFGSSTYSFFLREYRTLNGLPRSSTVLVNATVLATDPLFYSGGTVI